MNNHREHKTVCSPFGVGIHVLQQFPAHETKSHAPTLLFLHGLLQSHLSWLSLFATPQLAHCHLVALDLRGHGSSDAPNMKESYHISEAWAMDLDAVITQLQLAKPIVVAWSYGGRVLGDYLDRFGADSIAGIVLVAATLKTKSEYFAEGMETIFANLVADDLAIRMQALVHFVDKVLPSGSQAQKNQALAVAASVPLSVVKNLMGRSADYSGALSQLTCPILVVHGTEDAVLTPCISRWAVGRISHSCPAHRLMLMEGCGHAPFIEQPNAFAAHIESFYLTSS